MFFFALSLEFLQPVSFHPPRPSSYTNLNLSAVFAGATHPDTLAAKSNLAELHIASGDPAAGAVLQQEILDVLGVADEDVAEGEGEPPPTPTPEDKSIASSFPLGF